MALLIIPIFESILRMSFAFQLACANGPVSDDNASIQDTVQSYNWKPRNSILSNLNEADGSMSLVRSLLLFKEFDTRGLCAATSWWLKNTTYPEEMRTVIQVYGNAVDSQNQHVHPTSRYYLHIYIVYDRSLKSMLRMDCVACCSTVMQLTSRSRPACKYRMAQSSLSKLSDIILTICPRVQDFMVAIPC